MNLPNKQNIRAVLLDFDGVVAKTIEDHYRTWNLAFSKYVTKIEWDEFCLLEGQSLFVIGEQLCRNHRLDPVLGQEIGTEKNRLYKQTASFKLYEDVEFFLEQINHQGWKVGLVTGALRDRFEHFVDQKFKAQFDVIITADDVKKTKPDPEPYLKAAKNLGYSSEQCIVVENAPLGVDAAVSAGMFCFALTTTLDPKYLIKANRVCSSLTQVWDTIHAVY